ncbi:MAG: cytochrome-c oxidase, cbb3-type subunit III [Bosea sp. (in: a-proteobacteria)]
MSKDNHKHIDDVTGTATTGHEWDGIRELETPMPRWWLWTLYVTIVWAVGYWILYPAWPLVSDNTRGLLGYSSRANVAIELDALNKQRAVRAAGLETASLDQIRASSDLFRIAVAQGKAAFGDNCSGCHGLGGGGAKGGYPNLNDDDWIWGGSLDQIHTTLLHGIRWTASSDTRISMMPAFGLKDALLKPDEIDSVANHVRTLSSLPTEAGAKLDQGKELFAANCAACHGEAGKGNMELGAPNLTDQIWLYGSDIKSITETIKYSRAGVMPSWKDRLDPVTIKSITVYVHSLGGGQ